MRNIQQWLTDIEALPDFDATSWRALNCEQEDRLLDERTLLEELKSSGPLSGWHQEPGGIQTSLKQIIDRQNKILSAEWFNETDCIQVLYAGKNLWQFRRIRLQASNAADANCLAQKISHLRADGKGKLHYYRLWQADADLTPAVQASVLFAIDEA